MHQGGTVLVFLLLFLFLLSLMALTSLTSSQLEVKMTSYYQIRRNLFDKAERGLVLAESSLSQVNNPPCLLSRAAMHDYLNQPNDWWLSSSTCHFVDNRTITAYVIEELELVPCSRIPNMPHMRARFYRITVYTDLLSKSFPIKLQTTFVKPEKSLESCKQKKFSTVLAGRQSWYEF